MRTFAPLPRGRGSGVSSPLWHLSRLLSLAGTAALVLCAGALLLLASGSGLPRRSDPQPVPTSTPTPALAATCTATATPPPSATPSPTHTPPPTSTPTATATPSRVPAEGLPTRIVIPAIGLDAPVLPAPWKVVVVEGQEVGQYQVPDNAAGFHLGSALPGHIGNTVLSGHHNLGSQVFRYLIDVEVGDEVILYVGELAYRYRVTEKLLLPEKGQPLEVRRDNARWIEPTADERLTLVTCWPYTGNSHRLILVALPVP